jgi:hypothetical protein
VNLDPGGADRAGWPQREGQGRVAPWRPTRASSSTYSGRPATMGPSERQPPLGTPRRRTKDADDAPQRLPPRIYEAPPLARISPCWGTRSADREASSFHTPGARRSPGKGSRRSLLGRGDDEGPTRPMVERWHEGCFGSGRGKSAPGQRRPKRGVGWRGPRQRGVGRAEAGGRLSSATGSRAGSGAREPPGTPPVPSIEEGLDNGEGSCSS